MMADFRELALRSLRDPREGLRGLLALRLPPEAVLYMALLAITLEALLNHAMALAIVSAIDRGAAPSAIPLRRAFAAYAQIGPLWLALLGLISFALRTALLFAMGRAFGGRGERADCALTVAWYDLLWAGFMCATIVVLMVVPFLTVLLFAAGGLYALWIAVNFIAEVHGFDRLGPVLLGLMIGYMALQLVLSLVPIG